MEGGVGGHHHGDDLLHAVARGGDVVLHLRPQVGQRLQAEARDGCHNEEKGDDAVGLEHRHLIGGHDDKTSMG